MSRFYKILIYFGICLFLGFLLTRQFYLNKQIQEISQPEVGNSIALVVTEYFKTNSRLRKQIDQLQMQREKLLESATSSQESNEILQENLQNYKIISGSTAVEGEGIEIVFYDKVDSTQIIDIINAIKNIGAEAIAVNNRRLGPKSYVESGIFQPPTSIEAIGNPNLLKESLVRPGGIIDQYGTGTVEKKEKIYLQPI